MTQTERLIEQAGGLVDGALPRFADGGYPICYLDGDNSVLCADCATRSIDDDNERFRPVAFSVHYEGAPEYCEQCNAEIASAYGDPDEDSDDEPSEPDEDDLTTSDHESVYQSGRRVLTTTVERFNDDVRAFMERQQFFPNVWFISDHGNCHLVNVYE